MRKLEAKDRFVLISGGAEKVYEIFEKKKTATLSDLQKLTGINYNTLRSTIRNLRDYGLIIRTARGTYTLSNTFER